MFWLACEELKREADPAAVEEKARFIYEDYISILSPKEVSVSIPCPLPPAIARWSPASYCVDTWCSANGGVLLSAGVAGFARARGGEPQHGGADSAHLRRGAAADLHADAPRLVPALRQLATLQGVGARGRAPREPPPGDARAPAARDARALTASGVISCK